MTDCDDSHFHTGQPVWVMQRGGLQRPAEYVGEGERHRGLQRIPQALVIYVDTPGADVIAIARLRPREGMNRPAPGAKEAGDAAARRAGQARQRGQASARRSTELREARAHPQSRVDAAVVVSATNAAKVAQFNAAQAHERAAEAYERAACAHQHAAEEAERCGDPAAARHRKAAAQDHEAARRTRHQAAIARQSIETLRLP